MPVRVTADFSPNLPSIDPIITGFTTTLGPVQNTANQLAGLGGNIQDTLGQAANLAGGLQTDPGALLEPNVNVNLNNVGGKLSDVVQVAPPRIVGEVKSLSQSVSNISNNATTVFNNAKSRVTTTKGLISLALVALCLAFGTIIQKFLAEMFAMAMRIQRTIIAYIDRLKKAIENMLKDALEAVFKLLPECPQELKDIAGAFKSVLGKASAIMAKVNDYLRKIADCFAIADGVMSLFDGTSGLSNNSIARSTPKMTEIVTASKDLMQFDAVTMRNEFSDGIEEAKIEAENQRLVNELNNKTWDETTGKLVDIIKDAEDMKDKIDDLIEDAEKHQDEDDPAYKKELEDLKEETEKLIESLEEAKDKLYDETEKIVDNIVDDVIKSLDDLEDQLMEGVDKAEKDLDDVFDKLEKLAEDFDDPEFQDKLVTYCMESEIRVVVE